MLHLPASSWVVRTGRMWIKSLPLHGGVWAAGGLHGARGDETCPGGDPSDEIRLYSVRIPACLRERSGEGTGRRLLAGPPPALRLSRNLGLTPGGRRRLHRGRHSSPPSCGAARAPHLSEPGRSLFDTARTRELVERLPCDRSARDELIRLYLPLVEALARRFRFHWEPLEDLVQAATLGLLMA